ncbi:hypothetical protein J7M22_08655 [Candidatus Poribacteria bacterium]|nr:hypothetical protein [Candidatus Poribacteria bacterium]
MRRSIILLSICLMMLTGLSEGSVVFLSIQDEITVSQGDKGVKVPLYVSDMTGLGIISAEIRVRYDPEVVKAVGVELNGTVAEGSSVAYRVKGSEIRIALTRAMPYRGEGEFAYVVFDDVADGTSPLEIVRAKLNEGREHTAELGRCEAHVITSGSNIVDFKGVKVKMDFTSNSSGGKVRVTLIDKRPEGMQPAGVRSVLNRYWVIDGPEGIETNLSFILGPGMIGPGDEANPGNLKLFRREGNSTGSWSMVASAVSADSATGEVRFEGISGFSQFTIGSDGDSSLPVEAVMLRGDVREGKVILRWKVEVDADDVGFVVYRRESGEREYRRKKFIGSCEGSAFPGGYTYVDRDVSPGQTYYYYVERIDISGERVPSDVIKVSMPSMPVRYALHQSYPNPFNGEVWIPYELGERSRVVIEIYDMGFHLVRVLDLGLQPKGIYESKMMAARWDGRNMFGEEVSSGVYYYVLKAGPFKGIGKMVVIK